MKKKRFIFQKGSSFIEIIIVIAIVGIVITGLITGTVSSLKTTNFSSLKSQATKYVQEGIELSRKERDISWAGFYAKRNQTWCVNKEGVWTEGPNCLTNIDNLFTRSVQLTWDGSDPDPMNHRMVVVATVTWPDSGFTRQSQIQTYLTKWK